VNRGWIARGDAAERRQSVGEVEVEVVPVRSEKGGSFAPPNDPNTGQWFSMNTEEMSRYADLPNTATLAECLSGISTDTQTHRHTTPDGHTQGHFLQMQACMQKIVGLFWLCHF
jgi:cytochrome oxidase assembly protein ShyY1